MKNVLIDQENMLGKARLRLCTTVEKEVQVGGSLFVLLIRMYRARYLFRRVTCQIFFVGLR